MNYLEKKELQILESKKIIEVWKGKVRFSLNSLFVFLSYLLIYSIDPIFGYIPSLVFLIGVLVFTQQLIRSYNYLKFHRTSLNALKNLHKIIDKKKGGL